MKMGESTVITLVVCFIIFVIVPVGIVNNWIEKGKK